MPDVPEDVQKLISLAIFAVLALVGLWVSVQEFKRSRAVKQQTTATWPLKFCVRLSDYLLGERLARISRISVLVVVLPIMALNAWVAVTRDGMPQGVYLLYATMAVSLAITTYLPKQCTISDRGIEFEKFLPWDHVRRWSINDRRLLLVVEQPHNRTLVSHLEIPLNGLPFAWRGSLEERLDAHVGTSAAGGRTRSPQKLSA